MRVAARAGSVLQRARRKGARLGFRAHFDRALAGALPYAEGRFIGSYPAFSSITSSGRERSWPPARRSASWFREASCTTR